MSSVRQIALALNIYADEYEGHAPYDAAGVGNTWVERIGPYLGYASGARYKPIFGCPSAQSKLEEYADGHQPSSRYYSNYGGNADYFTRQASLHLTRSPSKTMLIMDGMEGMPRLMYSNSLNNPQKAHEPFRHLDRSNAIYADMHGAQLTVGDVPYWAWSAMPGEPFWDPAAP